MKGSWSMTQLLDEDEFEESKAHKHPSLDQLPIKYGGFQCFKGQADSKILESNRRLLSVSNLTCVGDKIQDSILHNLPKDYEFQ